MPRPIYYEIYLKDILIQNTTSGKYAFTPDASRDTGSYDCIPRNIVGVGETKRANVKVNGKFSVSFTFLRSESEPANFFFSPFLRYFIYRYCLSLTVNYFCNER